MAAAEAGVKIFQIISTQGIGGLWEMLLEKLGDIKEMILEKVKDFVVTKIITAGITWLIGLLNPAAAFIKACKLIYDVVMFFVNNGSRIKKFVDTVLDSVSDIVRGNVSGVVNKIDEVLGQMVPIIIGFLASVIGLGGIGQKIREIVEKLQKPVNQALDFVIKTGLKLAGPIIRGIAGISSKVKAKMAAGKAWVKGKVQAGKAWAKKKVEAGKAWIKGKSGSSSARPQPDTRSPDELNRALRAAADEAREVVITEPSAPAQARRLQAIKQTHQIATLELITESRTDHDRRVHIHATVNPTYDGAGFIINELPPGPAVSIIMDMAAPPGRSNFERVLPGPTAVGLPASWVRAHLVGQGFGQESPHGIFFAPGNLNGAIQNDHLEEIIRELYAHRKPGTQFQLTASAEPHPGPPAPRLAHVSYHLIARPPGGGSWLDLFLAQVWVSDSVTPPPRIRVGEVETHIKNIYLVSDYENARLGIERP
jgi:hypothetical protein